MENLLQEVLFECKERTQIIELPKISNRNWKGVRRFYVKNTDIEIRMPGDLCDDLICYGIVDTLLLAFVCDKFLMYVADTVTGNLYTTEPTSCQLAAKGDDRLAVAGDGYLAILSQQSFSLHFFQSNFTPTKMKCQDENVTIWFEGQEAVQYRSDDGKIYRWNELL